MKLEIKVEIDIPDDGSVIVNESELIDRLWILTTRIHEMILQFTPSKTKIKIEASRGTERLHKACI